jgi:hypothetical protein
MKQTAVEWLVEQLIPKAMATYDPTTYNAIKKAKEMEKEQMVDWYATGQADTVNMYEQHLNKNSNTKEK